MKLEFLEDGLPDRPLIRLYAFDSTEAVHFRAVLRSLIDETCKRYDLHHDTKIEALNGCRLTLHLHDRDLGVVRYGHGAFDCVFTREGWCNVAFLVGPFCESAAPGRYQWLTDKGDAFLLLSTDGTW